MKRKTILCKLRATLGRVFRPKLRAALGWVSRRRGRHTAAFVEEEPDVLAPRIIYVVGEDSHRWFAAFQCPCSCGETIKLSLIPGDRPGWRLKDHWDGTASLAPSVWRRSDARATSGSVRAVWSGAER